MRDYGNDRGHIPVGRAAWENPEMEGTLGHDGRGGQSIAAVPKRDPDHRRRGGQGVREEAAGHEFRPCQAAPGQRG